MGCRWWCEKQPSVENARLLELERILTEEPPDWMTGRIGQAGGLLKMPRKSRRKVEVRKTYTFTIDGHRFSNLEEFYQEIDRVYTRDLPWRWGHNLDSLDDIVGGIAPDGHHLFIWENANLSQRALGYEETIRWLEPKVESLGPQAGHLADMLEAARRHEGPTLFDMIVEIFPHQTECYARPP